jgi:hypothetical protein
MLGQMRLDQDQVVQGNLQRRVACARATERLLDKHAERKYSASRSILTAALGLRKLPDNFNHLGSRILKRTNQRRNHGPGIKRVLTDEAIDEVDLSVGLSYQLGRGLLVDSCRRPTRILSLLQWREKLGAQRR